MGPISEVASNLKAELAVEVLRSFGEARIRVTGTSMLPAVWPGDIVTVRRGSAEEILQGEIVLSRREGRFFAHRVVLCCSGTGTLPVLDQDETSNQTHSQSGCALPSSHAATGYSLSDPAVAAGDLLGRIVSIERGGRLVGSAPDVLGTAERLGAGPVGAGNPLGDLRPASG